MVRCRSQRSREISTLARNALSYRSAKQRRRPPSAARCPLSRPYVPMRADKSRRTATEVPASLEYSHGQYRFERMPRLTLESSLRQRRIFSRSLHGLHRPFFAIHMPLGVCQLTTIGRKSGKPRKTYVRALRDGQQVYLVSIAGPNALWLKNLRSEPRVILRLTDGKQTGTARLLQVGEPDHEAAREAFLTRVYPFDYIENAFHRKGWPSRRKILELHMAWFEGGTPLVVDLEPPQSRRLGLRDKYRRHP